IPPSERPHRDPATRVRAKLTKTLVESIPPPPPGTRTVVYDTLQRGFQLRVYPDGSRVYYAYYRNAAGQERRPLIARHGELTVDEARARAARIRADARDGADPS